MPVTQLKPGWLLLAASLFVAACTPIANAGLPAAPTERGQAATFVAPPTAAPVTLTASTVEPTATAPANTATPLAEPSATLAAATPTSMTYVVIEGDVFVTIAERFGLTP